MQTLSESLMREIAGLGVEVEQERWWDPQQKGDILHYIMRPPYAVNVRLAHEKGFKVIMTENLDQTASRTKTQLFIQRQITRWARRLVPGLVNRMAWDVYQLLDAMVYVVPIELKVAQYLFDAPADRGYIISQGLEEQAIQKLSSPEGMGQGDFLVSVAVISERKNSLLLAEAARKANVPIVFLGKPLVEDDYYQRFLKAADGKLVFMPDSLSGGTSYATLATVYTQDGIYSTSGAFKTMVIDNRNTIPFIYFTGGVRNKDGTFNSGARFPLSVHNATEAEEINWYFGESPAVTDDEGYFTVRTNGTLRAEVRWPDGTTDVIVKEITVKE